MTRKKLLAAVVLLVVLAGSAGRSAAAKDPVEAVTGVAARTLAVQQQTQKELEAWEERRQQLTAELQNLKVQEDLLRYRQRKLQGYLAERRAKIAALEKSIADRQVIARELEPYLDEVLARAKTSADRGLPFLAAERRRRFAELEKYLASYEAPTADKLRRVLEMLQIEAGYGHHVEAYDQVLELPAGKTSVKVFRLGRIGLYYLTLDGRTAGWYDRAAGAWQPLSGRDVGMVREALRMAMKQRTVDLVRLPVGRGGW
ncbi:MAG: DUF3450 domain-containing protein [Deltaproteobacteria bacterium]|nr:DUF3450 domain-containing protein [Deltaproteobacteria bacterium]